ncbi:MAG: OmpA family protein [Treponema sp.]|nr:OmpA family protein [Treponema sp.]
MAIKKITGFLVLVLLTGFYFIPGKLAAEVFEFRHIPGAKYRIVSVVDQAVFINGLLSHRAETLYRIVVNVTDVIDGRGQHSAIFQTFERFLYDSQVREHPAFSSFTLDREYYSVFERDRLGRLTIDPQYFMPVVRNVPVFPGRSLNVGDTWNAEAHEVHDFRGPPFGISEPYRIPFRAFYQYVGERQWKGVSYPAFTVNYNVESRPPAVQGQLYPVRISGTFNQLVYWDRMAGQERAYTENFRIAFEMSNGARIEFRGTAEAEYVESDYMDRDQIILDIIDDIVRLDIPDVDVRLVDEGISISLENIRFYPDSNVMLPGEQEKLDIIAEILRRYPDRDILVSGHAALAGSRDYLMTLSQERARAVADYLISKNVRSSERIITRGYGAERPIADNSTEEGMRRNRRVEITILEN